MSYPKQTNTRIGRKGELYAEWLFNREETRFILDTHEERNKRYDGTLDGYTINVKMAQLHDNRRGKYFVFTLHDHADHCDFFILFGYRSKHDTDPLIGWMIPSSLLKGRKAVSIGLANKGRFNGPGYIIEVEKRKKVK